VHALSFTLSELQSIIPYLYYIKVFCFIGKNGLVYRPTHLKHRLLVVLRVHSQNIIQSFFMRMLYQEGYIRFGVEPPFSGRRNVITLWE
jgi:hypothetical protein